MDLDHLDRIAAESFEGYIVRKDLALKLKGQYPVPTYVGEFLLGRYCSSTDEEEIREGLSIVERQMRERTVRAGEEELYKARAREEGTVRIIDLITARLDSKSDSYLATLPSLRLSDVRIEAELVSSNERMLTGGFYAEVELEYDAIVAQEQGGHPFGVASLRPIQLSTRDALQDLSSGREAFTTEEWKHFLLRSIGLKPDALSQRAQDVMLLRMVPFVERNYNMVELGPRGTGKSHLYQQVSPYSHLISGGKATVAKMFVNNATGQRGLVAQYDVVCFDEISGVSFDQKDGVNIMKGYMESGEFSRGRESIRADGGIVMVGNFSVDVEHQQRIGHLFGPMPPEMRDDTAFMDRLHAYLPGWDVPKMSGGLFTKHLGLVSDFLSECWDRLRSESRVSTLHGRVQFGSALSGRDATAVQKTVSGLLKLLYPNPIKPVPDEDLEWAVRLALESRRRVKEQQKRIGSAEFRNTHFSYRIGEDDVEQFITTPELQSGDQIGTDPLPPGQVWSISPGGLDDYAGLYRVDVSAGPGSGVHILNQPSPPAFRESVRYAEQNLYAQAQALVGDRDPRGHEFSVQLRAFDAAKSGAFLGLPALLALCGALLEKSLQGGIIAIGGLNLGGGIDPVHNAVEVAELATEKGATTLLAPISARRQLNELSDEMATKLTILYYSDAREDLAAALMELLDMDERGEIPRLDRIVIETTGLADPAPILHTISTDNVLQHHFSVDLVLTTVDAVNGNLHLDRNPESVKQVAAADKIVVTKTDLLEPGSVGPLIARLGGLNPSARMLEAAFGDVDLIELLRPGGVDTPTRGSSLPGETHRTHETYSISVTFDGAVDWAAFGIWFSMLLHAWGEDVLRVKGFLDVGESGPVMINGVQHVIHPPDHLREWPDEDRRSRIVLITRGIRDEELLDSLRAFRYLLGARPVSLHTEQSPTRP